jgi:hypothetical protein
MRWAFISILFFCYYFFSSFYCKTDRLILPWHSVLVLSSWVFKIRFPPAISLNLIVQRYKKLEFPILGAGQKVCFIGLTPVAVVVLECVYIYIETYSFWCFWWMLVASMLILSYLWHKLL